MDNGIELEGFDELEELLQEMTVDEADEKKAMKKAIEVIAEEVERNTPTYRGKLKRSIKKTVKKEDLATVGTVRFGVFWDLFQEFGTSKSKKNLGFFEHSVNKSQDEAIEVLSKELLK